MIDASTSLEDVAGAVAASLREIGLDPVVVGGSASTLHAPEAYRSRDVDMVFPAGIDGLHRPVRYAMESLGFLLENNMFVHRSSPFTVEFLPGPVAIGEDTISEFALIATAFGDVRVLHAIDAVCDRLNKYCVWHDADALSVAVAVARACRVEPSDVESFFHRHANGPYGERYGRGYKRFRREMSSLDRVPPAFGFTTSVRVVTAVPPTHATARDLMLRIQRFLDDARDEIGLLDYVDARGMVVVVDDVVTVPLTLRSKRSLSFAERVRLADEAIDYLRTHANALPEILEIVDDGAPPIAFAGTD